MSLAALQRDFRGWLTTAEGGSDAWAGGGARPGLAVYHNAYRVQLADCLIETFERVDAWLGGDAFIVAARAHIESTPPNGWTLGCYGEDFAETLDTLYPADPEVAELGRLEWALSAAFEGRDAEPIDPAALAAIDWDTAVLRFVPTLRRYRCRTNAGAIWSALAAGETPPAAAPLPQPGAMLIWRQGFTPCFRTTEMPEHEALELMAGGATFGALCRMLVNIHGEDHGVTIAGAMLGQWLSDGLIAAVDQAASSRSS